MGEAGGGEALSLFRFHLSPFPPETPDTQANVKDSLVVKSLAFVNSCIQKVYLFIRYFSRKFKSRVMPVWKSNEFSYLLPLSHPQGKNIVNESFPLKRFSFAKVQYFCFDRR